MLGTDKSEFLAVYGRRRVGKSFLVDEVYKSAIAFRTVGVFIKSEELTEESYRRHIEKVASVQKGWKSLQRSPQFFTWAGITFELVAMVHQRQLANALRLGTISACYSWKGTSTAGTGAQIDMVLEWKGERTDYLFEIKFSESTYAIDADYEQNLRNKIDAFLHSKKHNPIHSINLVFLTTFGLSQGIHNAPIDTSLTMDVLFKQ